MGRKHIRTGKHLFLCIACLSVLLFSACSTSREMERHQDARSGVERPEGNDAAAVFDRALEEEEQVLSLSSDLTPEDEVLYNIGIRYADPDNEGKDYEKARETLNELTVIFPESPLVRKARTVISLLDGLSAAGRYIDEKEKEMALLAEKNASLNHFFAGQKLLAAGNFRKAQDESQKMLAGDGKQPLGDEALFNLGLISAHSENPDKDFDASAGYFRRLIEEYPQSPLAEQAKVWLGVLTVLEKSKQVDIEIEEKKKELEK
ncbi:MAG: tetratricopeptide repeat protein [Nitrospiraceae bacterium]|nr:MAG: tetratricopeptide repeat protein [Nitrospiraceae bacterium]